VFSFDTFIPKIFHESKYAKLLSTVSLLTLEHVHYRGIRSEEVTLGLGF